MYSMWVNSLAPVGEIDGSVLICRGAILDPSTTFLKQGVQSGDPIVCLPEGASRAAIEHWLSITADSDYTEHIHQVTHPETNREIARLADLSIQHRKKKRRIYTPPTTTTTTTTTILPTPALAPNEDPLPVPW